MVNTFPLVFSNKVLVIRSGIHKKMLVRIANGEDPGQTNCERNFRTSTLTYSPVGQLPMQSGVLLYAFVDFQNQLFQIFLLRT